MSRGEVTSREGDVASTPSVGAELVEAPGEIYTPAGTSPTVWERVVTMVGMVGVGAGRDFEGATMDVRLIVVAVVGAVLLLPSLASGQHGDVSDEVRFQDELNPNEFMITGRVRAVRIPDFALNIFWDEHASHWSEGQRNMSYGGEFVWRRGNDFELGVAFDYADLSMPGAFWKEDGENAGAAEYTEIDMQIYSIVFSAYWFWDVQPWFTPYLGGGIGPGFIGGDVVRYDPQPNSACESGLGGDEYFAPREECFVDGDPNAGPRDDAIDESSRDVEDEVPPVVPMINLTAGLRFNIADYGVLKLETGIYPYLFAGLGFGAQF